MSDLKIGKYKPVYFLMGEEPFFIDKITEFIIQNALPPSQHAFNQIVMYGKDVNIAMIDNTARRYPMMHDRMVVVVKEAHNIKTLDELIHYIKKPQTSTILVISYKAPFDKRKKLFSEVEKHGQVAYESKKLYDNKVPDWVTKYLTECGYGIDIKTCQLIVDFLGNDLSKISNELDKLIISLPKGTKIIPEHIEKNIGISKDFNVFELQKAFVERNFLKANRIIKYFGDNPDKNSLVATTALLYSFFSKILICQSLPSKNKSDIASALKINPFFADEYLAAIKVFPINKLANIFSILREYDLKSKGVDNASVNAGELYKEMVFKIMH
jgi:DNA polymerase-3 subunit delta